MIRLALALLALAAPARAVDHTDHVVGLGVATQLTSSGRPAQLSFKVALQPRVEVGLLLGASFGEAGNVFSPGLQASFVLVPERRMNLYFAAALIADLASKGGGAGLGYQVGPGVELFLEGVPNLGFFLQFGLWGELLGTAPVYAATGAGSAGLHYWF